MQRDLTLLEFDTRGIVGIFGRGSRAAIAAWPAEYEFDQTTYLTQRQIRRIDDQAKVRAQELEQEASLALARADRAYWNDTGISGREADFRAYLERYPDGLFADRAQGALDQIMADNQEQANAAEPAHGVMRTTPIQCPPIVGICAIIPRAILRKTPVTVSSSLVWPQMVAPHRNGRSRLKMH